jgi:anti-sigma B factor antagonist
MDLELKKTGEFVFLKPLRQNIDTTASTEFKARVMDLINQGHNFFLLNLSQVDFVDSSGLGAMISILKTLTLNHGDIVLCELNTPVQNLFNLTRMNSVFKIYASEKEGLESLIEIKKHLGERV